MTQDASAPPLPSFEVEIAPPDLGPWRSGNAGLPGFWTFHGARPGPHVVITALVHGNEIAGAVTLDRLLRAGPRPMAGTLTLGFANLAAYDRFDPAQPTASRYVDEDLNRVWDAALLDGQRQSLELARARAMRPLVERADVLLDLHSMLWPSESLILSGPTERGRALAASVGTPGLVVSDHGHTSGRRLIDFGPFVRKDGTSRAVLVEAGQHWRAETVPCMERAVAGVLAATGLADQHAGPAPAATRYAEVTEAITASSGVFSFVRPYRGGDVVSDRDTLIAIDGSLEIRTPHDDCLLVMPSLRPSRGHTAVRLAKFL